MEKQRAARVVDGIIENVEVFPATVERPAIDPDTGEQTGTESVPFELPAGYVPWVPGMEPGGGWDGTTATPAPREEPEPDPDAALKTVQIAAARRDLPDLLPSMTPAEKAAAGALVPAWTQGASYTVGDLVRHDGAVWRCISAHTADAPNWTPPQVPALFEPA